MKLFGWYSVMAHGVFKGTTYNNYNLTPRTQDFVCCKTKISMHKQHNWIWSVILLGPLKLQNMGGQKGRHQIRFTSNHRAHRRELQGKKFNIREIYVYYSKNRSILRGILSQNTPRGGDKQEDLLAKSGTKGLPLLAEVFFEILKEPSIKLLERVVLNISLFHSEDWRSEIFSFLFGICPSYD